MALDNISFLVDAFALVLAVILAVYLAAFWAAQRQRVKHGLEKEKHYYYRMRFLSVAALFVISTFLRVFHTGNDWIELLYSLLNVVMLVVMIMTFSLVRFDMKKTQ